MTTELARLCMRTETDVISVRRRIREVAERLGFDTTDQVRVAMAVSEWGRVAVAAGTGAAVCVELLDRKVAALLITIAADDAEAFAEDGAAAGCMVASNRLMDTVERAELDGRAAVRLHKHLPAGRRPPGRAEVRVRRERLAEPDRTTPLEELRAQDVELLHVVEELQHKQRELVLINNELRDTKQSLTAMYDQLSAELEETNRGVVALYAELDERGQELRDANTAKSRFLASVTHELRSPLHSVSALARLLREPDSDPLSPAQDQQVRLIQSSAAELLGLVNDLLDLAKAESGTLQPRPDAVDIGSLFSRLRSSMRPLTPDGVELVIDLPPDLPPVHTDGVLLGQVLRNLVSNALKFTEHGQVTVAAALDPAGLAVAVSDTGIGIAPEHHELVFEEFFQVPGRLQSRWKSTGLGLAYARRVVEALGGTISLTSAPGTGSTFTAVLPLAPPPRPPAHGPGTPRRFKTVLVVDDEAAYRAVLRDLLGGLAERIVEAEDADGALAMMREVRPDLVLLDLRMPGGGGAEVLRQTARQPDLRDVPIVIVTSAEPGELDRLGSAGRPVLAKSQLDRQSLLDAIAGAAGAPA